MAFRRQYKKGILLLVTLFLLAGCQSTKTTDQTYPITIINQSSHDICSVKFYNSGSYLIYAKNLLKESWFKTRKILAGQTETVLVPEGFYDIRIKTCDGLMWGYDSRSVPREISWTITDDQLIKPVR